MRPCFAFSNIEAADGKPAVLSIYDEIGFWGVQAGEFIASLGKVQGKEVHVEINSPGGDVFAALAMYNALRASGKKVVAKVMGVAASAASLVFMAGDDRIMPKNTHLMVHNPWTIALGNAEELRDTAETLDKIGASLVATYVARSGQSEDDVKAMLAKDTWLNADESKANGFATEVVDEVKATAKFDMDRADLPEAVRAVFNSAAKPAVAKTAEELAAEAASIAAAAPFADQVQALAKDAGFEAHANAWALAYTKPDEVTARIGEAREIKSFCALAKKADQADGFIKAGKSVADVRAALLDAQAADDKHIDTTKPRDGEKPDAANAKLGSVSSFAKRREAVASKNSNQPINDASPSAVSTASPWAKRRLQTTGV